MGKKKEEQMLRLWRVSASQTAIFSLCRNRLRW